jgi:branched-chain amino acid transport system ATP-binding protein
MMLRVEAIHVRYGSALALHGVTLEVAAGQIACLLGRNGAGKTTTLKAIIGLARLAAGEIAFEGERIDRTPAHQIARLGVAYVPEDRRVFGSLTVEENVRVAAQAARQFSAAAARRALEMFPDLLAKARQLAGNLSGGQQQMLAIARAAAAMPRLMLLDEPTEGLSPMLAQTIQSGMMESRARGMSILLVEQNLNLALSVGDVVYVLSRGAVAFRGTPAELLARPDVIADHLGVGRVKQAVR